MGRQYEHISTCGIDYYGLLSYYPGECTDSMVEEGVGNHRISKNQDIGLP